MSSCGYQMTPIEFSSESDEEAKKKAREFLENQRKFDPEGTANIICLQRIDVKEEVTRINLN
ncbi:hypothetical protein K9M47_03660 [Candidatus Gracilibacteria bacterium]|nr:hypothetical protein [Candidatus Gracilibacteria bacterium]MCF7898905.1 hypothetical protein [Candidatus Paceibacterota bacterium]